MGLIADAKACYIEVVSGGGTLKVNGAVQVEPLDSIGGFWVYFNANGGLTALTVTTTGAASFRRYLFA